MGLKRGRGRRWNENRPCCRMELVSSLFFFALDHIPLFILQFSFFNFCTHVFIYEWINLISIESHLTYTACSNLSVFNHMVLFVTPVIQIGLLMWRNLNRVHDNTGLTFRDLGNGRALFRRRLTRQTGRFPTEIVLIRRLVLTWHALGMRLLKNVYQEPFIQIRLTPVTRPANLQLRMLFFPPCLSTSTSAH